MDSPYLPRDHSAEQSSSEGSDSDYKQALIGCEPEVATPDARTGGARTRAKQATSRGLDNTKKIAVGKWMYLKTQPEIDLCVDTDDFELECKELLELAKTLRTELKANNLSEDSVEDHLVLWLQKSEFFEYVMALRREGAAPEAPNEDTLKRETIQ